MFMLGAVSDACPGTVPEGITGTCKLLSFKSKPDFEMPGDDNGDNVYEVTVMASDGAMTAMRPVTVKVIDVDEMGEVELSSRSAQIGVPITATLKDSDGGVPNPAPLTGLTWTWERDDNREDATPNMGMEEVIEDAESDTYTPTAADKGKHLRAIAMYTDRTRHDTTLFMEMAVSDSTTAVTNNPDNQAPEFKDGARTSRIVEENTMALTGDSGRRRRRRRRGRGRQPC